MELTSARDHLEAQRRLILSALALSRRKDWLTVLKAYQVRSGQVASAFVPVMLAQQQIDAPEVGMSAVAPLVGFTGQGYPAEWALKGAKTQVQRDMLMRTILQDTARQVAATSIASRPKVTGYVRVLEGASCARCVILAGKFYKYNQGFKRHPRCDCRHAPTNKEEPQNPRDIFDAMSAEEQDRTFTRAGAEAIRMGADMNRVVNARQGIQTAQVLGRQVKIATVGKRFSEYPRLMPETILAHAESREHALDMLRRFGYLI